MTRAKGIFCGRRCCNQYVPLDLSVHVLTELPFKPWTATMLCFRRCLCQFSSLSSTYRCHNCEELGRVGDFILDLLKIWVWRACKDVQSWGAIPCCLQVVHGGLLVVHGALQLPFLKQVTTEQRWVCDGRVLGQRCYILFFRNFVSCSSILGKSSASCIDHIMSTSSQ